MRVYTFPLCGQRFLRVEALPRPIGRARIFWTIPLWGLRRPPYFPPAACPTWAALVRLYRRLEEAEQDAEPFTGTLLRLALARQLRHLTSP